jgi:hypothetical protein
MRSYVDDRHRITFTAGEIAAVAVFLKEIAMPMLSADPADEKARRIKPHFETALAKLEAVLKRRKVKV